MTSYPPPPSGPTPPPYGTPPPTGTPYPPPSAPPVSAYAVAQQDVKVPPVAWLVPVAALLAIVGAATPWFHGKATVNGRSVSFDNALYSWKDGKIGLLAPILLVILAVGVIGLLQGKKPARFNKGSAHPVSSAGKGAIIAGAITLVCVIIAWFLVTSQYKFTSESGSSLSWDGALKELKAQYGNAAFSRGPQIGYFLTIVAGVLAIVAGIAMMLAARGASTSSTASTGFAPPPQSAYPQPGYPQPGVAQPGVPQPGGYAPPPDQSGDYAPPQPPSLDKN